MTFRELKAKLDLMTDQQLDWPVVVFEGDSEHGHEIECIDEQAEDVYWLDGDCYGMKKDVDEAIAEDEDLDIKDFTVIPKGTVTLHYALSELENVD